MAQDRARIIPSPSSSTARKWDRASTPRCPRCWPKSSRSIWRASRWLRRRSAMRMSTPLNGGQITGTSNSVQDAWEKLRTRGSAGAHHVDRGGGARWRIDPAECRASERHGRERPRQHAELMASSPRRLPECRSRRTSSSSPHADFRLIGKSQPRLDTPGKVDGSAEFGLDVKLPGMLYAALAQSPSWAARSPQSTPPTAEKMPGVRRVLHTASGVVVVADHFWQALQGAQCIEDHVGSGRQCAARQCGHSCRAQADSRDETKLWLRRTEGDVAAALKIGEAYARGRL